MVNRAIYQLSVLENKFAADLGRAEMALKDMEQRRNDIKAELESVRAALETLRKATP